MAMVRRPLLFITAIALGALALVTPSQSQAQLREFVTFCKKSLSAAITCVIVEQGVEQVIQVGMKEIVDCALGKKRCFEGRRPEAPPPNLDDLRLNGIGWPQLKELLVAMFKNKPPLDDAQARAIIAASCATRITQICALVDFSAPRSPLAACSAIKIESECKRTINCTWRGGACSTASTRDVLKK